MILYDVACANDHVFEAWFKDSASFDGQVKAGEVACPVCGDIRVHKALMAPNISTGARRDDRPAPSMATTAPDAAAAAPGAAGRSMAVDPQQAGMVMKALREMRRQIESNCEYVGEKFSEEVRKIHYGETEHRNIYGEASEADARALSDEGIEVARIPWVPNHDS